MPERTDEIFIPDQNSRRQLAVKLGLMYSDSMQDWEWEVSDYNRLEDFLNVYENPETTDSERGSLMEIMLDSLNDLLLNDLQERFDRHFGEVAEHLKRKKEIHRGTIIYWTKGDFVISDYLKK